MRLGILDESMGRNCEQVEKLQRLTHSPLI
jgi:hypothetical protein